MFRTVKIISLVNLIWSLLMGLYPSSWGQLSGPSLLARFERAEGISILPGYATSMPMGVRAGSPCSVLRVGSSIPSTRAGTTVIPRQSAGQAPLNDAASEGQGTSPTLMIPGPVLPTAAGGKGMFVWGLHHPYIPTTCYSSTSLLWINTFFLCWELDSTGVYGEPIPNSLKQERK